MRPLGQRILLRGVPVALAMGIFGYLLGLALLAGARMVAGVEATERETPNLLGPVIFALLGFATAAAIECVRKPKK